MIGSKQINGRQALSISCNVSYSGINYDLEHILLLKVWKKTFTTYEDNSSYKVAPILMTSSLLYGTISGFLPCH